jgi:hypothetical protein
MAIQLSMISIDILILNHSAGISHHPMRVIGPQNQLPKTNYVESVYAPILEMI